MRSLMFSQAVENSATPGVRSPCQPKASNGWIRLLLSKRTIARLYSLIAAMKSGGGYTSQRVTCSSRDLFLMLTDRISELPNSGDEEFGLTRLEQLLTQYAAESLTHIWELIMKEVRQHGAQQDDQSLLLVRVRQ